MFTLQDVYLFLRNAFYFDFNDGIKNILIGLFELSTSIHKTVRISSQKVLKYYFEFYSSSFQYLLPRMLSGLKNSKNMNEIKGILFLLFEHKTIFSNADWKEIFQLYPLLFQLNFSSETFFAQLLQQAFSENDFIFNKPIKKSILSDQLSLLFLDGEKLGFTIPTIEQIDEIEKKITIFNKMNKRTYFDLFDNQIDIQAIKNQYV